MEMYQLNNVSIFPVISTKLQDLSRNFTMNAQLRISSFHWKPFDPGRKAFLDRFPHLTETTQMCLYAVLVCVAGLYT